MIAIPTLRPVPTGRNPASFLAYIEIAAGHWWTCHNALKRLDAMTPDEREACREFETLRAEALEGMRLAEIGKNDAKASLEAISELPVRWHNWPERRLIPRPDLW